MKMAGITEIVFRSMTFNNKIAIIRNVCGIYCKDNIKTFSNSRFCSTTAVKDEQDPAPVFFNKKVQSLLKALTRPDPNRIFRRKMDGRKLLSPTYQFMTDEQLAKTMETANKRMSYFLQMPPVLKIKPDDTEVLSFDPEIRDHHKSNYVFTDITYGIKDKDRLVVVRQTDGTLRMANNNERKRMMQVYFPQPGREMFDPKMFHGEYLEDLLNRHEYEFILNRATIQYEPNESEWMRVVHAVYEHVNNERMYNKLLSTRFYGPMVFHFAWNKDIDNLLLEQLKERKIEDAVRLVTLYQLIHPDCLSAQITNFSDDFDYIMQYVNNDAKNTAGLKTAVNVCKEWKEAQLQMEANIKKAHGVE